MAMIKAKDAQKIASLQRQSGREVLRQSLGWPPFDEEDDARKSIILDTVYDNFMFCVGKGFNWDHIAYIVKMVCEMLNESQGQQITSVIKLYTEKCSRCAEKVPREKLKVFTEYFFSTFMTHYKLYQYVFTQPREDRTKLKELSVETVEAPEPFSTGKPENINEYEQKLCDVDNAAKTRQLELEAELNCRQSEREEQLRSSVESIENMEQPLTKEKLLAIITDLARTHIGAASVSLNAAVSGVMEDLEHKLERTSIPRPPELGPPQRYQIKTPAGSKKRDKSARKSASKTDSRSGSRSSKTKI